MQKMPISIKLLFLWVVIMGGLIFLDGVDRWSFGVSGIKSAATDLDPALIRSWFPHYRTNMIIGVLWALGGLGFLATAYGLWGSAKWTITAGLISGAAIVLGWAIFKILSMNWGNGPSFLSLLVGFPAFYLLTQDAHDYFK